MEFLVIDSGRYELVLPLGSYVMISRTLIGFVVRMYALFPRAKKPHQHGVKINM